MQNADTPKQTTLYSMKIINPNISTHISRHSTFC